MRTLTIEAASLQSAQGLYSALSDFSVELIEYEDGKYRVAVDLTGNDRHIVRVLDAVERYVTDRGGGPARLDLDGRNNTLHPEPTDE
jgi:hypothetical protein